MTRPEPLTRPRQRRTDTIRGRQARAAAGMQSCELCIHRCGVDRSAGPAGRCAAGPRPRIFSAQVEVGDEAEIIPTFAIALAGCNLRCAFCVTGAQSWNPRAGAAVDVATLAEVATAALTRGAARSVQVLGGEPTIFLSWLLEFAAAMPVGAPLILKTNGMSSAPARRLLDGVYGGWIVDYKFGNDACALRLSGTPGYLAAVQATVRWAATRTNLIIRHLVMPGHLDCCWRPVASWIATNLPLAKVSVRYGYWPAWRASAHPPLHRALTSAEVSVAQAIAADHSLRLVP